MVKLKRNRPGGRPGGGGGAPNVVEAVEWGVGPMIPTK